jgi:hypothetical protein
MGTVGRMIINIPKRTVVDSFSAKFCAPDERDSGHSPVYLSVMIPPLLKALMRFVLFAF